MQHAYARLARSGSHDPWRGAAYAMCLGGEPCYRKRAAPSEFTRTYRILFL
jgi:hypothetical protein